MQKEVSVIVDIEHDALNEKFAELGEIKSDSDFEGEFDPRWKIEEKGYNQYNGGEIYEETDDAIIDRKIERFED